MAVNKLFGALLVSVVSHAAGVAGVSVEGGLTILAPNDLENKPAPLSAAILLHQPATHAAAAASCASLGETLWNGTVSTFTSTGLSSSLAWQLHQGFFPKSQKFLIANDPAVDSVGCAAISGSTNGSVALSAVNCTSEKLPALCTQTAPVSRTGVDDPSEKWRVDRRVGGAGGVNERTYTGYRDHYVWKFRGVRYSAQPVRFEPSTVFEGGNGTNPLLAVTAGADCPQPVGEVQNGTSEDCLFMNIWTPYLPPAASDATRACTADKKLRPVMLYIYGGGFRSGSGKNPNTDGTNLASRGDVVVVSVNYRVGALGFLVMDDGVHNGNYGIGDIITALEWVKRNIVYFGGDPERVLVFGESAGAMAVRALLASPRAKGLFSRAISQSGPAGGTGAGIASWYDSVANSYAGKTSKIVAEANCSTTASKADQIACLRAVDVTTLINLPTAATGLVVDGTYLTAPTLLLNSSTGGYTSDVHVLSGTNRDELAIDSAIPGGAVEMAGMLSAAVSTLNPRLVPFLADPSIVGTPIPLQQNGDSAAPTVDTAAVMAMAQTAEQRRAIFNSTIRVAGLALYTCHEQATAYSAALHPSLFASYRTFLFNRTYNPTGYTQAHCDSAAPETDEYFKCHAGEQLIVFGNLARASQPDRDGRDSGFARMVVDIWAAFARTGNPDISAEELRVRGFADTAERLARAGSWSTVKSERPMLRLFQWDGGMRDFSDVDACEKMGFGLKYFEDLKS